MGRVLNRYMDDSLLNQQDLIAKKDWNVLLLLDACRVDYLEKAVGDGVKINPVNSMANVTYRWVNRFVDQMQAMPFIYFTANPVASRELSNYDQSAFNFQIVRVYEEGWGKYGPLHLPSVHPYAMNCAAVEYLAEYGQPEHMIVHYLQPHAPYIGRRSIPFASWGNAMKDDLTKEVTKIRKIKKYGKKGELPIEEWREAYLDNVSLVIRYALALVEDLAGKVIITADHGEMLGENDEYEHSAPPIYPELMVVPWIEIERGGKPSATIPHLVGNEDEAGTEVGTIDKLKALGYA